jgi:hypothetical protein
MTEAEWLACTDPAPMQAFLDCRVSERKVRLYRCACCRHIWSNYYDERSRRAVVIAEMYADQLTTPQELARAHRAANRVGERGGHVCDIPYTAVMAAAKRVGMLWVAETAANHTDGWLAPYSALIRDVFGNPFRPVAVEPGWLTADVVALAKSIYADRAFDRMPILADALQDAGCENADVLDHCRGPGPHVRGCWVVDLVLGKS